MNTNKVVVSISCLAYNHKEFIRQTLDSFLMQKTTFRFEVVIHDDCSTDGTKEIIEEYTAKYPNIIFPMFQSENQYSIYKSGMNPRFNFPRCRGKYIALCEGDDYWTDPYKLQHQVDFLEANLEYIAVAENGLVLNSIKNTSYLFSEESERDVSMRDLVKKRRFPTASVVFRNDAIKDVLTETKQMCDTILWCYLASKGKLKYLTNVSSVYNRGIHGLVEGSNKFEWAQKVEKWNLELIRLFDADYKIKYIATKNIYKHYLRIVKRTVSVSFLEKNKSLLKCLKLIPKMFLILILKK